MIANKRKHAELITSIENASILRKFTVLFTVMSLLPMGVLCYFYLQIHEEGAIQVTKLQYKWMLTFIIFGIIVGYMMMKQVLIKLIDLSAANKEALLRLVGPDKLEQLSKEHNEINVLSQSFDVIVNKLEESVQGLEVAKATLHSVMTKVGQGIANMQNIDSFLELILETMTEALSAKCGVLFLVNEEENALEIQSVFGEIDSSDKNVLIRSAGGDEIQFLLKGRTSEQIYEIITSSEAGRKITALQQRPYLCSVLKVSDTINGVILVTGRTSEGKFNDGEYSLLHNLASQTAVAIENAKLNKNMEETYFETISALALAVDAKDRYSRGHLDRVAEYCVAIGEKLGLEDQDIKTLRDAARLHDLGKIGIPDEVLHKTENLNDQDWILMRRHPEIGESIIKPVQSLAHLCDIVRHHHEKLDGSGYPDALSGEEVTPLVRITTIADIYDALTSDRPYRKALTPKGAIAELRKMEGKLDQDIVDAFAEVLEDYSTA